VVGGWVPEEEGGMPHGDELSRVARVAQCATLRELSRLSNLGSLVVM
jgi:hypothetical protein